MPVDEKKSLVYFDGYVVREQKTDAAVGASDTTQYYEEYGSYTDALNRRGLTIPPNSVCQWKIFCFIVFEVVKHVVCRLSLRKLFMQISEFYAFYVPNHSFQILANILPFASVKPRSYVRKLNKRSLNSAHETLLEFKLFLQQPTRSHEANSNVLSVNGAK